MGTYILWGALALLVFGLVLVVLASITVVLFDFLQDIFYSIPSFLIKAAQQVFGFFAYDVRSRFDSDYVKNVLAHDLASSGMVVYYLIFLCKQGSNKSLIIDKFFKQDIYTFAYIGTREYKRRFLKFHKISEYVGNDLLRINVSAYIKAFLIFKEFGYFSANLLVQLDPFWEDIIEESFLRHLGRIGGVPD